MHKRDYLKESSLGFGLDSRELEKLSEIVNLKKFRKGEILFLEGDQADGFYLLLEGRVKIYKASPDGKEHLLHHITSRQLFAEAAIFQGGLFPANCLALENSLALFFPKQAFLELIKKSPQISLKIIGSLSAFLRQFAEMIENLSLKEVSSRVASYLVKQSMISATNEVTLTMTKSELARYLGTLSETLSRSLRKLTDQGIIKVTGRKILILDAPRLGDIAAGEKIQIS